MPTVDENPVFWFVLVGLACWRISSIITREEIFFWFRALFGTYKLSNSEAYPEDKLLAYLVNCIYCMSVWIGFLLLLIYVPLPNVKVTIQFIVMGFAISGFAMMLERFSARGS
jgi:hypothetical protein